MQVSQGSFGRVLIARLEHGDAVVPSIIQAAQQHNVRHAVVWLLGAASQGALVVGPRKTEIPPERWLVDFSEGRELVATGTLFPAGGQPSLHLHAATGRGETTLTGCVQPQTQSFLVVEVVIAEILGISAERRPDPSGRFKLLELAPAPA